MLEYLNANKELVVAIVGGLIGILGSVGAMVANHFLTQARKITVSPTLTKLTFSKNDKARDRLTPVQLVKPMS